jgi:hypothetical protein
MSSLGFAQNDRANQVTPSFFIHWLQLAAPAILFHVDIETVWILANRNRNRG